MVPPSMAYLPSNSPVVPVATAQPEVGRSSYVPHSSVPAKFVPYGNLTAGNGGTVAQFPQPVRMFVVFIFYNCIGMNALFILIGSLIHPHRYLFFFFF